MKPRLRLGLGLGPGLAASLSVRPAVREQLLQLGFLLPWAGATSSSSSSSSESTRRRRSASLKSTQGHRRSFASSAAAVATREVDEDNGAIGVYCSEQGRWADIPHAESSAMAARRQQQSASVPPSSTTPSRPRTSRAEADTSSRIQSNSQPLRPPPALSPITHKQSKKPQRPNAAPIRTPTPIPISVPNSTRRPTSVAYVYEALSTPNPPPPTDFLTFLRAQSQVLTYAAGLTLAKYADRMDDQRALRGVWREMVSSRIAPLGAYHQFVNAQRQRQRSRAKLLNSKAKVDFAKKKADLLGMTEGIVTEKGEEGEGLQDQEEEEIDGYFRSSGTIAQKTYKVARPNRLAMKTFPPLESIPRDFDSDQLVRHLHYLLLERSAPGFEDALDLLLSTFEKDGNLGIDMDMNMDDGDMGMATGIGEGQGEGGGGNSLHETRTRTSREDDTWMEEVRKAENENDQRRMVKNGYKAMNLLNLYLAYLPTLRQVTKDFNTTADADGNGKGSEIGLDLDPLDLIDSYIELSGRSNINIDIDIESNSSFTKSKAKSKSKVFEPILNKQTLHLSVRALIDIATEKAAFQNQHQHQHQPIPIASDTDHTPSSVPRRRPHPLSSTPIPTPIPIPKSISITIATRNINRLLATISHFRSERNIHPGPETYRHLMLFALTYDLKEEIGKMAYEGWFRAFEHLKRRVAGESVAIAVADADANGKESDRNGDWARNPWILGKGHHHSLGDDTETVRFRFMRVGSIKRRWKRVLGMIVDKGWIKKLDHDDDYDHVAAMEMETEQGLPLYQRKGRGGRIGLDWGYEWIGDTIEAAEPEAEAEAEKVEVEVEAVTNGDGEGDEVKSGVISISQEEIQSESEKKEDEEEDHHEEVKRVGIALETETGVSSSQSRRVPETDTDSGTGTGTSTVETGPRTLIAADRDRRPVRAGLWSL
ncbi:hypothetical protein IAT40_007557 [Kwoniella sp. CBS 6097]